MVTAARAVVCLALWLSVCHVRSSYVTQRMNKTILNLLQHYKIPAKERFNGKPVFSREPLSSKMEAKRVFMGGVLETYEELIGKMLEQLPTPTPQTAENNALPIFAATPAARAGEDGAGGDVRTELSYILSKISKLKQERYKEQVELLPGLMALKDIKIDNRVVQSKALWELPWLYEEASSLYDNIQIERRRRRRRARKTHQRG